MSRSTTGDLSVTMFASNNISAIIAVVLGGTQVPLPDNQSLNGGFVANVGNTAFTVPSSGLYLVNYNLYLTTPLLVSTGVGVNGVTSPATTHIPTVSSDAFSYSGIISLTAGDIIDLRLFGLLGAATLRGGAGAANLTAIRLGD